MSLQNNENWRMNGKNPKKWEKYFPVLSKTRAMYVEYTRN